MTESLNRRGFPGAPVSGVALLVPLLNVTLAGAANAVGAPRRLVSVLGRVRVALRAMSFLLVPLAALGDHIGCVIGGRAKEQVVRSDADPVIAAVKHPESIGDRAVGDFPGVAVRWMGPLSISVGERSVPVWGSERGPFPAGFGLVDLGPEPDDVVVYDRDGFGGVRVAGFPQSRVMGLAVPPGVVLAGACVDGTDTIAAGSPHVGSPVRFGSNRVHSRCARFPNSTNSHGLGVCDGIW